MKHGDISNELPKRLLVTTDLIMDVEVSVKRKLLIIPSVKINKKDTVLETRNSETWLGQAG